MWWKYYGFNENPLDIRPKETIFGLEEQEKEIINCIENGEIFLVYGPIGSGKTSLALKLKNTLQKNYNFIYLNGEENSNPNISDTVIKNKIKFSLGPIKLYDKRRVVLVLDELQGFKPEALAQVKALYDANKIFSVFMIQVSPELNAAPSFISRVSKKIEIKFPDKETIKKIILTRLRNKIKIDDEFLEDLIKINNNNVRSILINLSNILLSVDHTISILSKEILIDKKKIEEDHLEIDLKISPQQLKILEKLINQKLTIKQISELTNIPYNTISKQISRLVKKGILIKHEKDKQVFYEINSKYYPIIMKKIGK